MEFTTEEHSTVKFIYSPDKNFRAEIYVKRPYAPPRTGEFIPLRIIRWVINEDGEKEGSFCVIEDYDDYETAERSAYEHLKRLCAETGEPK